MVDGRDAAAWLRAMIVADLLRFAKVAPLPPSPEQAQKKVEGAA